MKTLCITLLSFVCSILLSAPMVQAQEAAPAFRAEATTATRQLAAAISLDDARQLPVRRLIQLRLSQEAEVRQQYTNDPDMLQKKLVAIGQEYTEQLRSTLTPGQYQRLLAAAPGSLPATVAAIPMSAPATATVTTVPAVAARSPATTKPKAKPSAAKPLVVKAAPVRTMAKSTVRPAAPKNAVGWH